MADSEYLRPISRNTLPDEIVERLTGLILEQKLKPGDRLPSEQELMRRLQVGRSSLREAIKLLSALGAVKVVVGEGMFVGGGDLSFMSKPLSWALLVEESNAREVMEARLVIEAMLAELAAERATDGDVATIYEELEALGLAVERAPAGDVLDLPLHLAIAKASHNRLLFYVLATLHELHHALALQAASEFRYAVEPPAEYEEMARVCEAIRAHDARAARAGMEAHVRAVQARLVAALSGGAVDDSASPA